MVGSMRAIDLAVSDAVDWDHEEAVGGVYDVVDCEVDDAVEWLIERVEGRARVLDRVRQ